MSELPGFTSPPVWELDKHDGRLVAGEREYKGRLFFELRLWAGQHGDKATAKGVTLPVESVEGLANALTAYAKAKALQGPQSGSQG
ncbi:transcriptional coactivator p15/PC4 family protein [Qipengyuania sp. S6317L1]|uniref:PC4/YdbC family ssDNA-binding protein n=1 Tax=Qipengyuania sp. S6317L1 TaxID=2926410 RepID=UPI001FF0EE73|nr:PC4/YdbC family ssDNA-binding protein [Qipengyuania sp. S6317L1]MCK0098453.1 transcriptional coactivator p15/PC4 family protein [Qipengyuania sp. S6317L1]